MAANYRFKKILTVEDLKDIETKIYNLRIQYNELQKRKLEFEYSGEKFSRDGLNASIACYRTQDEIDKLKRELEDSKRQIECQKEKDMELVFLDYNKNMTNFIHHNNSDEFKNLRDGIFEKEIIYYQEKERQKEELEKQLLRLSKLNTIYENAIELHRIMPEIFVTTFNIPEQKELLISKINALNAEIGELQREIDSSSRYSLYKINYDKVLISLNEECANILWNNGSRPENFEKNVKYILDNYDKFKVTYCSHCGGNEAKYMKPSFLFKKELHMFDIKQNIAHESGDQGGRWSCR